MKRLKYFLSAILLTVTALCCLCGCGNLKVEGTIEQNAPDMVELNTWFFTSGFPNNEIKVHTSIENAIFTLTVDIGSFYNDGVKEITCVSGERVYWRQEYEEEPTKKAYVEIVLEADEHIVGYALVKIRKSFNDEHKAKVVKAVTYPKIDGEYQNVTYEQLSALFKKLKK